MNQLETHSYIALGLMSGTSLDGIDAAMLETDGDSLLDIGPSFTLTYPEEVRKRLALEVEWAGKTGQQTKNDGLIHQITELHVEAISDLLGTLEPGSKWSSPNVIGFHGHTVLHRPQQGFTQQIGNAQLLADRFVTKVVSNFRQNDVANGGEGAPLAPIYHAAMFSSEVHPTLIVNIGGISNVTWIGPESNELVAFDTGPGNCLLDMWVEEKTGSLFDKDGRLAASGTADRDVLESVLSNTFFDQAWPKSLDRTDFDLSSFSSLSVENGAATLVEFTVQSIVRGIQQCPAPPRSVFVTGGGRHNKTMMMRLASECSCPVRPVESQDWDGDSVEAQAFAFMAVRSLRGLPISFPGTTGATIPLTGGELSLPRPT